MADDDEKTDLEKVGMFVEGPYDTDVTLFRPDIKALMGRDPGEEDEEKRLGGPFPLVSGHKLKAATNDWPFSEFLYLWEEEPYQDPSEWRRKDRAEQAEKNIADEPFLSMVGPKLMNGLGTYYGTFIEEMEAFSPETKDKKEDDLAGLPNFLTNPGKKGTGYGYANVTINPYPERDEDMEDPFYDISEAMREGREAHEEAIVGDGPFVPSGFSKEYFDPNPYFNDRDPDGEEETYDWDRLAKADDEEANGDRPPWIPNSYTKKINGNKDVVQPLEKFPTRESDDEDPYEDPPREVFRKSNRENDEDLPAWKPPIHRRTRQTKSVISYNVNLRVNATNFHRYL
jgi:hypothetical protein